MQTVLKEQTVPVEGKPNWKKANPVGKKAKSMVRGRKNHVWKR
jgi:hypothetical protein